MSSARVQRTISPIDGSVYVEREVASVQHIEQALARAEAAQKAWSRVPVEDRAAICRRMVHWCVERADTLAEEITHQMGRPIVYSPFEVRRGFSERAHYMADIAVAALADIPVEPKDNF